MIRTASTPPAAAPPPRRRRPGPAGLAAGLAATALLLAACGSSGDDTSTADFNTEDKSEVFDASGAATTAAAPAAAGGNLSAGGDALGAPSTTAPSPTTAQSLTGDNGGAAPAGADNSATGGLGAGGGTPALPSPADLGRQLIFTAQVEVEVDDVAAATDAATAAVAQVGGFLFGQSTTGGAEASSQLTFKVKPEVFDQALDALGAVGKLRNQTVSTDDVTERVVDLDSRIQVAQLGVDRLRTALAETTNLKDYAEIEALLLQRESDLEVMKGQQRTLADQVALATINLTLTQDRLANNISLAVSAYEGHDQGAGCPGQGDGGPLPAGDAATVCFDITNEGDQTLTKITITDTVLGIDDGTELITVFGSLDSLAPGQSALVAYETEPERDLRLRTRVTAVPTNGVDPEATGAPVDAQASFDLDTFEPARDPGFGDGWSAGGRVLSALWTAVTVTLGFLLPMLVILAPLAAAVWWALRRQRRTSGPAAPAQPPAPSGPTGGPSTGGTGGDNPPPPPPAPPAPEPVGAGTGGPSASS